MLARIRQNSRIPGNRFRKVNSRLDAGHTLRLLIVFVRRGDKLYFRERCVNILGPKLQRFLSAIIITTVVCRVKSNRYEQITAASERGDGRSELKSSWRAVKIYSRDIIFATGMNSITVFTTYNTRKFWSFRRKRKIQKSLYISIFNILF